MRANLLVLNVHGGTSASEIVGLLDKAEAILREDDLAAEEESVEGGAPPLAGEVQISADAPFVAADVGGVASAEGGSADGESGDIAAGEVGWRGRLER